MFRASLKQDSLIRKAYTISMIHGLLDWSLQSEGALLVLLVQIDDPPFVKYFDYLMFEWLY